jgi:hypothetical protein
MEISFNELDNSEINNNEINNNKINKNKLELSKYWEDSKKIEKIKIKKKVTFDDILTNMNLVVNQNGVLQYMSPIQKEEISSQYNNSQNNSSHKINEPLQPSIKHSYIYNKYFKDYKDMNTNTPEIRVPKTMEEYKKMLLEDKIKRINQQKRISQIKSTKLFLPQNIMSSQNSLKKMNFY